MSSREAPKWWLWFDFETTGLWNGPDEPPALLEMAAVLLPYGNLERQDATVLTNRVFSCRASTLQAMDTFVQDMHTRNGLLREVIDSSDLPEQSELDIVRALTVDFGAKRGEVCMAGSGIASFDVPLLRLNMFGLYNFLHYAPHDLGTGRRMLQDLWPDTDLSAAPGSSDESNHRALDDVWLQLAEARWYRENFSLERLERHEVPD